MVCSSKPFHCPNTSPRRTSRRRTRAGTSPTPTPSATEPERPRARPRPRPATEPIEICFERRITASIKESRRRLTSKQRQRQRKSCPTKPRRRTRSSRGTPVPSTTAPVRCIPRWRELSAEQLYGEILVRKTWRQIFNRRRNHKIHFILADEHKQLPIIKNQAVLNLVAKTGNFIPTPSAQALIRNIPLSLNIFCVRVYNQFSGFIHRRRIQDGNDAATAVGIHAWKPITFGYNALWYQKRREFVFSKQNTTWHQNFRMCPQLPIILAQFEQEVLVKTKSICNALRKGKWQNIPLLEREAIKLINSQSDVMVKKTDKGLGPAIVSRTIYLQQLNLHLRDATYLELIDVSTSDIMQRMYVDFQDCVRRFRNIPGFKSTLYLLDKYHQGAIESPHLCPIDLLMKEHKPPSASGLRTRAIIPNNNYFTCQESNFLHCMLAPKVFSHPFVLRDSLSFVRMLDKLKVPFENNLRFATYDVTALYPSIDLERGLQSLKWFMETQCDFQEELRDFILILARFVLTHCYISCPEISTSIFHQIIGTAMGTSFAVVYAIIHMIRIETDIIKRFKSSISLYTRFIDDGCCGWHGSDEDFENFASEFSHADPSIKVIWTSLSKGAIFLDVSAEISGGSIHYEVYSKPGNAYAYLPLGSFHVRCSFPAWIKAELMRRLTRSSDQNRWAKSCQLFYSKLRDIGYGSQFLLAEFAKISWADRTKAMIPKVVLQNTLDRKCVWSVPNSLGLRSLFRQSELNLTQLDPQIFPGQIKKITKGASRLSTILRNRAPPEISPSLVGPP